MTPEGSTFVQQFELCSWIPLEYMYMHMCMLGFYHAISELSSNEYW